MFRPVRRVEVALGVRDSRFLAVLAPAGSVPAAESRVHERSSEHPDASHHCWAYRLWSEGEVEGVGFDAGEPSGTAGRPILGALRRADVVQAVCVVSRWFGGTRLGTGGLTRAYARAARGVVEAAREAGGLEEVGARVLFEVRFGYEETAAVRKVLARLEARELDGRFDERVTLEVSVGPGRARGFAGAIADATGNAARTRRLGERL
ncbi:MAG: YigZ family protein, partial [Gemmatimonadota bacterium]|nr:YigZ family protein [Gemmatimonadota bacterium]